MKASRVGGTRNKLRTSFIQRIKGGMRLGEVQEPRIFATQVRLGVSRSLSPRAAMPRPAQELCGPACRGRWQAWLRRSGIINVAVAAVFVALIEQRLEIQRHIGIRRPKWHLDRWQAIRKGNGAILSLQPPPAAAHDDPVRSSYLRFQRIDWHRHDPIAIAHQVDLDQTHPRLTQFLLLAEVLLLTVTWPFVCRAYDLNAVTRRDSGETSRISTNLWVSSS
jgi:hypothetical protein